MNVASNFFEDLVKDHETNFSSSPLFFKSNDEMIQLYVELDFSNNYEDAEEKFDNFESSSLIIANRWLMRYDLMDGIWIFRRPLDYNESQRYQYNDDLILHSILKEKISKLNPYQFEELILEIFQKIEHYELPIERPISKDGGIEFTVRYSDPITNSSDKIFIQVKKENKAVSVNHTRSFIGVLDIAARKTCNIRVRGIIVSIVQPSRESIEAAKNSFHSIDFISLDRIIDLMVSYGIGCQNTGMLTICDNDFWNSYGVDNFV